MTDTYTQAIADEIVARISTGEPLAVMCREANMPGSSTVNDWRKKYPEFKAAMDQARDDGYDAIAHRTRETARLRGDSTKDVQRDKLIIDTDLKLLAKWDPRRYGDRTIIAGDAENPLTLAVEDARAKVAKRLGVDPDAL